MSQLKPMIIVILMLTSALTGCTSTGNENIVQIEINSPLEGDWIEGQVQISITTKMTVSEGIEIWINDNYYSKGKSGGMPKSLSPPKIAIVNPPIIRAVTASTSGCVL